MFGQTLKAIVIEHETKWNLQYSLKILYSKLGFLCSLTYLLFRFYCDKMWNERVKRKQKHVNVHKSVHKMGDLSSGFWKRISWKNFQFWLLFSVQLLAQQLVFRPRLSFQFLPSFPSLFRLFELLLLAYSMLGARLLPFL